MLTGVAMDELCFGLFLTLIDAALAGSSFSTHKSEIVDFSVE